ncbi:MAG: copper-binding protein [Vitreoscilla sp.]|nr:copper-binding protein [Vitreoscilla sp.]
MSTLLRSRLAHATATLLAGLAVATAQATEGEIKKVDPATAKVTIRHGEIKNLEMPAMTMVFRARTPSLLDGLKAGDRVDFDADKIDGQYVVTAIRKSR